MKKIDAIKSFITLIVVSCMLFITMGISVFAAESEEEKELSFNSVVEVESYSVEEGFIEAGKEATVNLTLRNANKHTAAGSVFITVSSSSGMIYPSYGNDNQFFIGTLSAEETVTVEIPIVVSSNFNGDCVDLICNIVYVSSGRQINNTATMILPARGMDSIVVSSIDVSSHATLNNKSLLSISYYNKSTENINEASLEISGNVSDSTRTIKLGSVLAGKSYTEDCNIVFTESGEQSVSIKFDYTGIDGEQKQLDLGTFKVNVSEDNNTTGSTDIGDSGMKKAGTIIAILAAVAALGVTVMFIRER